MLDVAEETARQAERGASLNESTLRGLLEFFKVFADRCHHGKEEQLLSDEEQTALAAAFEKLEVEQIGAGTHERLHESMKRIIAENPVA
jgi:hemerythrin-like domain-containing protein